MKTFHNPENKQINFLDERFYTLDNVDFYPSVTTVLQAYPKGPAFDKWLKENGANADAIRDEAGESGSKVHDAIDNLLQGNPLKWTFTKSRLDWEEFQKLKKGATYDHLVSYEEVPLYSLEEWVMILKFVEFWTEFSPTLIANEFSIISIEHRVGGTVDIVCMINGERWLIDIKTSNAIHTSHELQIATYAMMFNEKNPDMPIHRTGILWLKALTRGADKKGKTIQGKGWQLKEFDRHYTEAFNIYRSVRVVWDQENPNYKPKNSIYPDRVSLTVSRTGELKVIPTAAVKFDNVADEAVIESQIFDLFQEKPKVIEAARASALDDSWMKK
jgi:hypothetical protein